jgi:hypothetical protein
MSKSYKRSSKRGGKRNNRKTRKGGSMLASAVVPFALLGLNSMFGKSKKSKSRKSTRRSRRM